MLFLFSGTDRVTARKELNSAVDKVAKEKSIVRISDANAVADLPVALQGAGIFGGERVVVLDGVFGNEEMRVIAMNELQRMRDSKENFFILEEKMDAATKKQIEKYAEKSEKFDGPKKGKDDSVFELANHLRTRDKKKLWVAYQRQLRTNVPEAIHGVLFWGAKQILVSARGDEKKKAEKFIAELAELPHQARRQGMELEYALEKFVLSIAPAPHQNQQKRP